MVSTPMLENAEPVGAPAESLFGAIALRLQLLAAVVAVPDTEARWRLYVVTLLLVGAVMVSRTSSGSDPLSKFPVAALRLLGALAPASWQMLNEEKPEGFGS